MNFYNLFLVGLAAVNSASTCGLKSFTQSGCNATHQGALLPYQQKMPLSCFTKTESGRCLAYFESYHYDPAKDKCVKAVFGGCKDGCQVFRSLSECENKCLQFKVSSKIIEGPQSFNQSGCTIKNPKIIKPMYRDIPVVCFIQSESGFCRASIQSFHFDVESGSCIKSQYGGCDDGCLAFKTIKECEDSCWRATSYV